MRYSQYYKNSCMRNSLDASIHFITWVDQIEDAVLEYLKEGLLDLPNYPYISWFGNKMTVEHVLSHIVKEYEKEFDSIFSY